MSHELGPIRCVGREYEAACSCGRVFQGSQRDRVEWKHSQHVHLEECMREPFRRGLGS